ncbi:hypothetical protein BTURTLESOX_410 [bacterium endosymbiont of Bathymodiolus sp. 5 South]|nr:hypothetical protein BTURTLESOX_410 [bacterium endosymbiont of Bathymodiolus sp. 5 South]
MSPTSPRGTDNALKNQSVLISSAQKSVSSKDINSSLDMLA